MVACIYVLLLIMLYIVLSKKYGHDSTITLNLGDYNQAIAGGAAVPNYHDYRHHIGIF